jgi:aspartyl/asparaginyl beta-hydroxylase (cupin superfamily)
MASAQSQTYTFENPYNGGANIIVPNLLKWRAKSVFNKVKNQLTENEKEKAKKINFDKMEGLLNSFLTRETSDPSTGQSPAYAFCPQLTARPFWKKEDSELTELLHKTLEKNADTIRQEYSKARDEKNIDIRDIKTGRELLGENHWKNVPLGGRRGFTEEAQEKFPKTIEMLKSFQSRIFSAEFIVMEPDTELPPHTDATNTYLVAHLGMFVEKNCGVQVHKQIVEFNEGDIIFFDQSYPHSAWNKGTQTRTNLLITFFHPEMTEEELDLIDLVTHKIKIQGLLLAPFMLIEYGILRLFSKKK